MENFYNLSSKSVLQNLKSNINGLSTLKAKKRLKKNGLNKLESEKPLSKLKIFLSQFQNSYIYILLIAGIISLFLKAYLDAGVIITAVIINTIIGFFQENKANNALYKLKKMIEHKAIVIRNGQKKEIDSSLLVVGDIIMLQAGNYISADARIIKSNNLETNESSLSGESLPSKKSNNKLNKIISLCDQKNMVFAGTVVVRGSGIAVITAIGNQTEIGIISGLVKSTKEEKTPLQIRLIKLSSFIGIGVGVISFVVVIMGTLQGHSFSKMFTTGVAIAVASIPEGMIVAVTVILVLGMKRILKKEALVKKLMAAETLGSITVICTDKTGTLTKGNMQISDIIIGEKKYEIENLNIKQNKKEMEPVKLALKIGLMCNEAIIENSRDNISKWKIIGTPTETALLSLAIKSGLNKDEILKIEPRTYLLPFVSERKYMITIHKKSTKEHTLYEKGAPEKLLEKSNYFYDKNKIVKLTEKDKKKLKQSYENLTNNGLRVIGVATKNVSSSIISFNDLMKKRNNTNLENESIWKTIDNKLTFVGFIAFKDPIRKEAKETIKICSQAGIRPIIVTGDHKLTAKAIAKEAGIPAKLENIITGEKIDKLDNEEFKKIVNTINIFARVNPSHKLMIVKALQENGEVVAMAGDGINDAPALKASDIGVSLGGGTDIAKEASDIILLDNNFKTIVGAVHEGRTMFSNIRKVVTYLISDSFSEIILIVGSIFLGMGELALIPAQILWINIINDGLPDFSLAFEKGDKEAMEAKPIKKNEPIMTKEMKIIIFGVGIIRDLLILWLFVWLYNSTENIYYSRTIIFAILGVKSLMSIFSLRNLKKPIWEINPFGNIHLVIAVSISFFFLLGAIYWSPLQTALKITAINSIGEWLLILCIGIASVLMIEIVKYYFIIEKKMNADKILNN